MQERVWDIFLPFQLSYAVFQFVLFYGQAIFQLLQIPQATTKPLSIYIPTECKNMFFLLFLFNPEVKIFISVRLSQAMFQVTQIFHVKVKLRIAANIVRSRQNRYFASISLSIRLCGGYFFLCLLPSRATFQLTDISSKDQVSHRCLWREEVPGLGLLVNVPRFHLHPSFFIFSSLCFRRCFNCFEHMKRRVHIVLFCTTTNLQNKSNIYFVIINQTYHVFRHSLPFWFPSLYTEHAILSTYHSGA